MNHPIRLTGKPKVSPHLGFFRYRQVADRMLLTNEVGDWLFVSGEEFSSMYRGECEPGTALYDRLRGGHFVRDQVEIERRLERLHARKRFLDYGPNLHVIVVTLRCNHTCVYCHASRADMSATETDMTTETAERVVDTILQTTSPSVTIEFQGGEPLVAFDVIRHIIEYAKVKNRACGKVLEFTLVSNLSLLDEGKLHYLIENRVQICTSIDGPAPLHDKQRKLVVKTEEGRASCSSFEAAAGWIRRINSAYIELGLDPMLYHVEALLTTTREALSRPREIVDTYVDLGCRAIFLRPVDPFGFAARTAGAIEYERNRYLDFYRQATDYILELNRQGTQVLERFAALFLTKILRGEDPNYLDIRNPCGAGIGQLAYDHDGSIFTCDEGRMVARAGSDFFRIGKAGEDGYRKLMTHSTVQSLLVASNLDAQPDCINCAYNPYCGVCPVHNYQTQGGIFGRMRESSLCAVHKGIQDYLFEKLLHGDAETRAILERWTTVRPRTHFLQTCSAS